MPRGRGPRHPGRDASGRRPPAPASPGPGTTPGAGGAAGADDTEPPVLDEVRALLEEPDPWPLVLVAASLLASLEEGTADPFRAPDADVPAFVGTLLEARSPASSALLAVLAALAGDEVTTRRIRRELGRRDHPLPPWIAGLRGLEVVRAVELTHPLGSVDTLGLGLDTATGDEATLVATVDHDVGTLVTDAFLLPGPHDEVVERFARAAGEDPARSIADLDPADARARLGPAVAASLTSAAPIDETGTWPACHPLVRWVLGRLPPGGTGYPLERWSATDRAELAAAFLASDEGRHHDHEGGRRLLDTLLELACAQGRGDPLRWSPGAVETLLLDRLPHHAPSAAGPGAAAALLADLVRFGHRRAGVPEESTTPTLAAVEQHGASPRSRPRSPGPPTGKLAGLVGGGARSRWEAVAQEDVHRGHRLELRELLAESVGGEERLRTLATAPLPDEPLRLDGLSPAVAERVRELGGLTDAGCERLLDREHRTACRRLLHDVASTDPAPLRRGRPETAAAAVVWIVATANRSLDARRGDRPGVNDLVAWFGLSGGPSRRAWPLLAALGVDRDRYSGGHLRLGSPRYLVASRRAAIREHWERLAGRL